MSRHSAKPPRLKMIAASMQRIHIGVPPAPKLTEDLYTSPAWRMLVARIIEQRGRRCEECGRTGTRIFADHIIELKDGGAPLDEANVRLLCGSCHTRKTAAARAARMRL